VSGPEIDAEGPVITSLTDFTADRPRDLFTWMKTGVSLRRGWYAMPGAVGLWLWSAPLERRMGSISVWTNEDDLERFVMLPRHREIMRVHAEHGSLRTAKWSSERFVKPEILREARRRIAAPEPVQSEEAQP
jgi:hypothetical protein